MQKPVIILLLVFLFAASAFGQGRTPPKYRAGIDYGVSNLVSGDKPYFSYNNNWGMHFGLNGRRASFVFSLQFSKNFNDSTASSKYTFFADKANATLKFSTVRAGFDFDYRLKEYGTVRPTLGAGFGYLVWSFKDPVGDTVIQTSGENNDVIEFNAAEMFLSASAGVEITPAYNWAIQLKGSLDYLTGLGATFSDSINSDRGRTIFRAGISISYLFGRPGPNRQVTTPYWPSTESWENARETAPREAPAERDSDGDGIIDKYDKCPNTPAGALTDEDGCPSDSDGDGVLDGLDDCPHTEAAAAGFVDIFGCPIDSDFDGVPDYKDKCHQGPLGAVVDETGCPTDSDGDGVYDGLDDCPHTEAGIEVDGRGCIDVSFLRDTMRVYVDYQSGSFEIDFRTRDRLQPLVRKLLILSHVKIEVNGYTDNVGSYEANQELSQKRANRMRDWLESQGIARDRMTASGKGETNFIASNSTAKGRADNRRIELIFSE